MQAAHGQAMLDPPVFQQIAALAYRESGLKLVPEKMMMVQSRLRHRLRVLELLDFESYASFVCSSKGKDERRHMISALTTNVSHFFREAHHFDLLADALLPNIRKRIDSGDHIRIWSAGCSNGQEPYSIVMHLLHKEPALAEADFKVLATDIDPNVISFARTATYERGHLDTVPKPLLDQFTRPGRTAETRTMTQPVKRCVAFHELNLLADWPMRRRFDAIFCRNVVIYFDTRTQQKLWPRFHAALADTGQFFLGHSERIADAAQNGFHSIGPTAYAKGGSAKLSEGQRTYGAT